MYLLKARPLVKEKIIFLMQEGEEILNNAYSVKERCARTVIG